MVELTTIIVSAISGALASPVILYLISWRKNRAEIKQTELSNDENKLKLHITQSDVIDQLKNQLEETIKQGLENNQKIQQAETEKSSLQLLVKIKEGEIEDYKKTVQNILLEQGRAMERERRCQSELAARKNEIIVINEKLVELSDMKVLILELQQKLKIVTAENMQMTALVKQLEEGQGIKHEDEEVV